MTRTNTIRTKGRNSNSGRNIGYIMMLLFGIAFIVVSILIVTIPNLLEWLIFILMFIAGTMIVIYTSILLSKRRS